MSRKPSRQRLGAFVRVRPFPACDFIAYHGTYAQRADSITWRGIKRGPRGNVWLASSPEWAAEHAAWRAAQDGCERAPLTVLKVRVVADPDKCPVFRPVHPANIPEVYAVPSAIPPEQILGPVKVSRAAVERGIKRGLKRRRRRPHGATCPPKIELTGRRR